MIWIIRLILLGYAILYFGIGAWAIIDPVKDVLELSWEVPSFMGAVGLSVSTAIGYSEVAGLYGGINLVVGFLCFLGLFSRGIAAYAFSLLAFLTFSIALGRYLFALIPSTPAYLNSFFIFEAITFVLTLCCFLYMRFLYNPRKNAQVKNVTADQENT
jgi:hypothetical protein